MTGNNESRYSANELDTLSFHQSILSFIGVFHHITLTKYCNLFILSTPQKIFQYECWKIFSMPAGVELPAPHLLNNCGRCLDYEKLGILDNFYCFYWNCPLFLAIVRCLNLDDRY